MKRVRSTNPELQSVIRSLKEKARDSNAPIWRDVADHLSSSRCRRIAVNLSRLNRHTRAKEMVVVPGKVLGAGNLDHPISVAAFCFSTQARLKISKARGKCLSIFELLETNPNGSNVKIME